MVIGAGLDAIDSLLPEEYKSENEPKARASFQPPRSAGLMPMPGLTEEQKKLSEWREERSKIVDEIMKDPENIKLVEDAERDVIDRREEILKGLIRKKGEKKGLEAMAQHVKEKYDEKTLRRVIRAMHDMGSGSKSTELKFAQHRADEILNFLASMVSYRIGKKERRRHSLGGRPYRGQSSPRGLSEEQIAYERDEENKNSELRHKSTVLLTKLGISLEEMSYEDLKSFQQEIREDRKELYKILSENNLI
jgi:hypothetical protein